MPARHTMTREMTRAQMDALVDGHYRAEETGDRPERSASAVIYPHGGDPNSGTSCEALARRAHTEGFGRGRSTAARARSLADAEAAKLRSGGPELLAGLPRRLNRRSAWPPRRRAWVRDQPNHVADLEPYPENAQRGKSQSIYDLVAIDS